MRTNLDHLPPRKQANLRRVVEILHSEFEDAKKLKSACARGGSTRSSKFYSFTEEQLARLAE